MVMPTTSDTGYYSIGHAWLTVGFRSKATACVNTCGESKEVNHSPLKQLECFSLPFVLSASLLALFITVKTVLCFSRTTFREDHSYYRPCGGTFNGNWSGKSR